MEKLTKEELLKLIEQKDNMLNKFMKEDVYTAAPNPEKVRKEIAQTNLLKGGVFGGPTDRRPFSTFMNFVEQQLRLNDWGEEHKYFLAVRNVEAELFEQLLPASEAKALKTTADFQQRNDIIFKNLHMLCVGTVTVEKHRFPLTKHQVLHGRALRAGASMVGTRAQRPPQHPEDKGGY